MRYERIDVSKLPPEFRSLIQTEEYILVFGKNAYKVPELNLKQYLTFSKYIFNLNSQYEEYFKKLYPEEKELRFDIIAFGEFLKENAEELLNYFINMFTDLFPNIPQEDIKSMTRKQLLYNVGVIQEKNFLSELNQTEQLGKSLLLLP